MTLLIVSQFFVSWVTILLRGIQTQNVVNGEIKSALFTSVLMSICNVAFIGLVALDPWASLLPSAAGGALGVYMAIRLKQGKREK